MLSRWMNRAKGVRLAEIMAFTKWQPHTVRVFGDRQSRTMGSTILGLRHSASDRPKVDPAKRSCKKLAMPAQNRAII